LENCAFYNQFSTQSEWFCAVQVKGFMRIVTEKFVELRLQRERVSTAKSLLKDAREQAQSAKVRRKLAKLLAKRAVEAARQAKANLQEAEDDLARAESLVSSGDNGRAARRKSSKSKASPRSSSKAAHKRAVAPVGRKKPSAAAVAVMSISEPVSAPVISDPAA